MFGSLPSPSPRFPWWGALFAAILHDTGSADVLDRPGRSKPARPRSALLPKADIDQYNGNDRFVPIADIAPMGRVKKKLSTEAASFRLLFIGPYCALRAAPQVI
jgi:hypothetical protein